MRTSVLREGHHADMRLLGGGRMILRLRREGVKLEWRTGWRCGEHWKQRKRWASRNEQGPEEISIHRNCAIGRVRKFSLHGRRRL